MDENIYLKEEHFMIRDMVREFAEKEVKPIAGEIDEKARFPEENIKKMAELGLLGIIFPEEYGGAGMDTIAYSIVMEELAKVCASHAITVAAHISLCSNPIYMFGTEQQKQKYLVPLATGKHLGAFGLTEAEAGSDAQGTKTTAEKKNGYYIINGSKLFCTNSGVAGTYIITAVTGKKGDKKEISAFIVERDMEGLIIGKKEDKMGWRGSDTHQIFFENLKVPEENLLGEKGRGFKEAMITLDSGRISVAAMSLGIAEGAYEAARAYSKERKAFGKSICDFQSIQFMLADMAVGIEAARELVYKASWLKDNGKPYAKYSAMAKLFASELAMKTTSNALQIHGGYGYVKDYPVERFFRDAKACEIGEGTSEIQRLIIGRYILREI
ncbi:acyl-CoA dehydrogenase [candidate division KSB1 bacterium]|nr:MAG: acyl-CoA dehydrogenase [candidate division KSB1 bacterium]